MPITYEMVGDLHLVLTRYTGRVGDDEFVDLYRRLFDDPAYTLGTSELADLREVESLDLSASALRKVEPMTQDRYAGTDRNFRTAILAPRDQQYGIGRMYEAFAEEGPENVRVCRTPTEALVWLQLDEDAVDL